MLSHFKGGGTHTVFFSLNGAHGNPISPVPVNDGELFPIDKKPTDPVNPGYPFEGWSSKENEKDIFDFETTEIYDDLLLYAWWGNIKTYSIKFYDGTTELTELAQTVTYNYPIQRPEGPIKEHYDFINWVTTDGGDEPFDFSPLITKEDTNTIPIYAKYDKKKYKVVFNANEGQIAGDISYDVLYLDRINAAPSVTKDGVSVEPTWWTTSTFTSGTQFTFGATGTQVEGNLTLYAKYTAEPANSFANDTWEVFFNEISGKTLSQIATSSAYSDDYVSNGNTFVDLERTVYYHGNNYQVRVINEGDVLGTNSVFTFEFVNIIEEVMFSTTSAAYNDSYIDKYLSTTVYNGLPTTLKDKLLTSSQIKSFNPVTSDFDTLERKLFVLSASEMGLTKFPDQVDIPNEGSVFSYYSSLELNKRIKKDINNDAKNYWIRTSDIESDPIEFARAWAIDVDGNLGLYAADPGGYYSVDINSACGLAPTFLI